ncbi:MAG: S41 family peptidase [Candidatus Brocadiaceae bacterium]|jgi:carboxyl-terminal processing protease
MTDTSGEGDRPDRSCPTYLPYLTWALLGLLCAWFAVWFFFQRPTTDEQLRLASFRRALRFIPQAYVYEVDQGGIYEGAMDGMLNALGDRYSAYIAPEQNVRLQEETEGEFGGIAVIVTARDGLPVVVEVDPKGPAGRAGVEAGDVMTHVEGEDISGLPLQEVVERIRGEIGTDIRLRFHRPATGETLDYTLTRAKIHIRNVTWKMLDDRIAYLRLRAFDRNCAPEVEEALRQIQEQGAGGLILDLRTNGGGLMKQGLQVSDMFLSDGRIVSVRTRARSETFDADQEAALTKEMPLVVLVDYMTASAAEILAGALQANGRATIVGTQTQGKGSFTELLQLPDGGAVNLTVGHYELAGGRLVEGKGIAPDVLVGELPPMPRDDPGTYREWIEQYWSSRKEQMERAVELLKEKLQPE